jgi:hypothetical protein
MKLPKRLGMVLLGIWLVVTGLIALIPAINISIVTIVMAIIAIAAGVLIVLGRAE